jgi:ATP-dependent DNA helicase RecQ
MDEKHRILKQYFGHDAFRGGQESLIDALLSGRDVLGVMPTGAGKSMCYQIPALLFDGITVIVSPLISLMSDQVTALVQAGVPAAYLNSALTPGQCNTVLKRLVCYGNDLTELDVSANKRLTYLRCDSNALTALNVSGLVLYLLNG